MENLYLIGTKTTPTVNFDYISGKLILSGESYPENSSVFYDVVIDWLGKYIDEKKSFEFTFKLVYFNTSSSKAILDILEKLEIYHKSGGNVKLIWMYEEGDEDIQDSGIEFTENLSLPCQLVEYND